MKTLTFYKALILSLFFLPVQDATAIVFEVTNSEEFQAALATAASTDSEDQILLGPGQYFGPFQVAFETAIDGLRNPPNMGFTEDEAPRN